jgi:hypothetical protein
MSLNAIIWSSSNILVAGISPAMILQKRQDTGGLYGRDGES